MIRKSIRQRRGRHSVKAGDKHDLQLTALMDVLIVMVIFLLKSYTTNAVAFNLSNIDPPKSTAQELPPEATNIAITPEGISFDDEAVLKFENPNNEELTTENATYEINREYLADGGRRIRPLYDAMVKAREHTELLISKAKWVKTTKVVGEQGEEETVKKEVPPKFLGIVVVQADKAVRYELLKKIFYTGGAAGFKVFKLVTMRKDQAP